jgi:hypothetical protein
MAKGAISIADGLKDVEKTANRTGADTVRLWERYRDQALLWRALALLQIPTTFLAIGAALIMFFFADTVIQVPEKPEPGMYSVKQLPDAEFISAATRVVNSIATYQPETARIQFTDTRKMLWQPALGKFDEEMMQKEIQAIEETRRSQLFIINQSLVRVNRYPERDTVEVRLPGTRYKLIGTDQLKPEQMVYFVKMTTIPKNPQNEYGIVVFNLERKDSDFQAIYFQDQRENAAKMAASNIDNQ